MYVSWGKIHYTSPPQKPGWFYVEIERDLANYYKNLSKIRWNEPLNGPHITFIAGEKEEIFIDPELYLHKPGWLYRLVLFNYDGIVRTDNKSYWINCYSQMLDNIRKELGLGTKKFGYHITLGNVK